MLVDEQLSNLRGQIESLDSELARVKKENELLRGENERKQHMQSAFQSNSKAYSDKMQDLQNALKASDSQILTLNG